MPTAGVCARCERRHPRPHALARAATTAGVAVILAWPQPVDVTARAGARGAADVVTLESLLERAGAYFLGFESRFADVVTEERYVQEAMRLRISTPLGHMDANRVQPLAGPDIVER